MAGSVFTKEVLLDTLVNLVPLGIITFFLAVFLVFDPWSGGSLLGRVIQFGLLAAPFIFLAILTYLAAERIE